MLPRREKRGVVMWILFCTTILVILALSFGFEVPQTSAQSQNSLEVNTLVDTNDGVCDASSCSLREAIANATSGNTVTFASGLSGTIVLTNGELAISTNLTITGPGAKALAISGNNSSRVFNITSGTVTLANMTIRNGQVTGNIGGGIRNLATLTIIGSEIAYNTADSGAGIYSNGPLNIYSSTLANNTATNGSGGGLYVDSGAVAIKNSTISNNSTTSGSTGGGISVFGANSFVITNSTIADNRNAINSNNIGGNIFMAVQIDMQNTIVADSQFASAQAIAGSGRIHSLGHNLLPFPTSYGDTATDIYLQNAGGSGLASLADNGGPTRTHALMRSSPAIDAGDNTACAASPISNLDQRGVSRPIDGNADFNSICDIGAFEAPIVAGTNSPTSTPAGSGLVVNTNDDVLRGDCTTLCSLRDALALAPAGSTLTFSVTGTITLADSITISRPVTITGPGASALTINASGGHDLFDVLANPVTISALRLGDDHASVQVLYVNSAASLGLSNVTMENDQGSSAVIENYGYLTVQNSTGSSNSGTLIVNGGTLTIDQSSFNGNGVVLLNQSTATVSNSTFSGNTTAIINDRYSPALTITNSTFDHNTGTTGSTLTINSGTTTVTASTFTNNTATTGGAIMIQGSSNVTINQSLFVGNTSSDATSVTGGGAISSNTSALVTITNSTLTGNTAAKAGGAIVLGYGWMSLMNDTIAGNSAPTGSGLGISGTGNGQTIYLANTIIANNLNSPNCSGSTFTNNGHNLQFGDSSCGASIPTGDPSLAALADNGGSTQTMALQPGSAALDASTCSQSVDQRGMSRPQGLACDIGAFEAVPSATPTPSASPMETPTFTPTATNATAPVVTKLDDTNDGVCDTDCSLREAIGAAADGATITFAPGLTGTIVLGSELYIQRSVTIRGPGTSALSISGNDAVRSFYVDSGVSLTLSQVSLVHGYALDYGGALNSFGTVTLNNVMLHDNHATAGGAVASQNGSITSIDSMFYNNTAIGDDGGAVLSFGGTLTFIRSTLYANSAARDGGAIAGGQVAVYNSTIQGNTASGYAGAIYLRYGASASVINVTLHGNRAGIAGYNTFNGGVSAKNSIIAEPVTGPCIGYVDEANRNIYFYGVNGGFSCYTAITDPKLAPLADNGGKTLTMALLPGSAAVDGGNSALCSSSPISSVDQRGVARPIDGNGLSNGNPVCDIGAFEVSAGTNSLPTLTMTPSNTNTPTNTPTPSNTASATNTPTDTPTPSTNSPTPSSTNTTIPTASKTPTRTFTPTNTLTPSVSYTPTPSNTATSTLTPSNTATTTKTLTPTATLIPSAVVNTLQDTNDGICDASSCSLREAIASVASGSTITFAPGLSGTMLLNGPLTFDSKTLVIAGPGADQLVIDANHKNGIYVGCNTTSVVISDLTIMDAGTLSGNYGALGSCGKNVTISRVIIRDNQTTGIVSSNGPVTITNSTIANNVGGGISTMASTTITNSTIVGNSASKGAGVYTTSNTTTIANSTIANNHSTQGSALATNGGTIGIRNTIIANSDSPMCSGNISSYGNNLQYPNASCVASIPVADPMLQALANNGGTTLTMALQPGSAAIDAGDNGACGTVPVNNIDQRGVSRPVDGNNDGNAICDVGAYEAPADLAQTPTPTSTQPIVLVVNKLADTNDGSCDAADCSLREAIAAAVWDSTINFAPGLMGTISLSSRLTITKKVVINGPGPQILTVSGNNTTGVFTVAAAIPAEIDNLKITNGAAQYGAAIWNQGILTLKNDVITHNYAQNQGGGIQNNLTLNVLNSEISENSGGWATAMINLGTATVANTSIFGNRSSFNGGAVVNGNASTAGQITIINTTIANNTSPVGGGLYNFSTVHFSNTIIASNTGGNCYSVSAAANSGNNLQYGDTTCTSIPVGTVRLMPPDFNGGLTRTLALMSGSAAIDAGSDAICSAVPINSLDQIGQARPVDANGDSIANCDIGAYEAPASTYLTPTITPTPTSTFTPTLTPSSTRTPTNTLTPSNTATVTLTPSQTNTATITPSMSLTPSQTYTPIPPVLPAVNKLDDTEDGTCSANDCSLREAIDAAANGAIITFAPDLTGTIELSHAIQALIISKNITIVGPGARLLTISGTNFTALLKIMTGANVSISGVSLNNGTTYTLGNDVSPILVSGNLTLSDVVVANNTGTLPSSSAPVHGGAITNTGTLTIVRSTLYSNSYSPTSPSQLVEGGAIYNTGTLTIVNSTITGNSVSNFSQPSFGGGIVNNGGTINIVNSTLANNTSSGPGDNVYNLAGTVTLANSIIARGGNLNDDLYGAFASQGHNLITSTANATLTGDTATNIVGYDPRLDGLAYNGATTLTRALLSDSPAIDQGDNTVCQSTLVGGVDQRGSARNTDGNDDGNPACDIGAYEAPDNIASNPTVTPSPTALTTFVVNKLNDTNDGSCDAYDCSLREAVTIAPSGANVTFANGLTGRLVLNSTLTIAKQVTVTGPGHNLLTITSEHNATVSSLFQTTSTGNLTLQNLTLADGTFGIYFSQGFVTVVNSDFHGFDSNAIYHDGGGLTITSSLFYDNHSTTNGAAVFNSSGTLTIANSTFTRNSNNNGQVAGLVSGGGTVINTTFAYNSNHTTSNPANLSLTSGVLHNSLIVTGPGYGGNCWNGIGNGGGNMQFGDSTCGSTIPVADPMLGVLADNGGPTLTLALPANSPAIDAGDATTCTTSPVSNVDQRGQPRMTDGNGDGTAGCDIGAYEAPANANTLPTYTPTATYTPTSTPMPTLQFTPTLQAVAGVKTVTTLSSGFDGVCDADCSLWEAIMFAQPGDTINFAPGLTGTIPYAGGAYFTKNLTIQGPGKDVITIDGGTAYQMFHVSNNSTLSISGLTLKRGAGIYVDSGSKFNLSDSLLTGATVPYGPIIDNWGTATITNSAITNNTATGNPISGNIVIRNGGGQTLTISGTTITGNSNMGAVVYQPPSGVTNIINGSVINGSTGYGISADQTPGTNLSFGTINVTDSTISNNANSGIYNVGSYINITHSTISNNNGPSYGGGIYNNNGAVWISANSTITHNGASSYGAGIYSFGNSAVISIADSKVTHNTGATLGGGGIANRQGSQLTITNSEIGGDSASDGNIGYRGGGIYNAEGGVVYLLNGSLVANNIATDGGAGIYNAAFQPASGVDIEDSTVRDNTVVEQNYIQLMRNTRSLNAIQSSPFGATVTIHLSQPAIGFSFKQWLQGTCLANQTISLSSGNTLVTTMDYNYCAVNHEYIGTSPFDTIVMTSPGTTNQIQLDGLEIIPYNPNAPTFTPTYTPTPRPTQTPTPSNTPSPTASSTPTATNTPITAWTAAPNLTAPANNTNVASLTPTLMWAAVTGATQYKLQLDDDPAFASPLFTKTLGKVTTYAVQAGDGLRYGVTYYWRVQAGDATNDWSHWSSARAFILTILKTPTNGSYATSLTPTFTWAAATGATPSTQYTLDIATDPNQFDTTIVWSHVGTALSTTVPSLVLTDNTYYWRVTVALGGTSYPMQYWSLTLTTPLPAAPALTYPTASLITSNNAPTFRWKATTTMTGGPFFYQIQIAKSVTFYSPVQDVVLPADTLLYTPDPTESLADGFYYWRVRAINSANGKPNTAGAWSLKFTFTVDKTGPAAPTLLSPQNWSASAKQLPTFSWSMPTGGKYYTLTIFDSDCSTVIRTKSNLTTTSYTLTTTDIPLSYNSSGAYYCWSVSATDALLNAGTAGSPFHFVVSGTSITLPATPTLLAPATGSIWTSATLPNLSWTMAPANNTFEVQVATTSGFTNLVQDSIVAPADTFSYSPSTISTAGLYYWRVRAINANDIAGAWATPRTFTIKTAAPAAATLTTPVQNADITSLHPSLVWTAVTGAKSYFVELATDSSFTSPIFPHTVTTATYTLTSVETLNYGKTYYWHVKVTDAAGNYTWSSTAQFTVSVHMTPKDGSTTTSSKPTFTWQAVTGYTYTLQVASDAACTTNVAGPYPLSVTQYTLPAVLNYGTYYWCITLNKSGSPLVAMPAWKFYVSSIVPGTPILSGPASNKVSNNPTPTFTWKAGTNADTYEIQISSGSTFASTVQDATTATGSLSYLADTLADGKYYWRVRSINAVGATSAWTTVWIITIDTQAPPAPTLVGPADKTTTTNPSLTLRWNASTGATKYEIALDTKNPPQTPAIPVGNVTSYLISWPHTVGTTYYWEVRAIDAADNVSDWSAVHSFKLVAGMSSASIRPTPTVDLTNAATSTPIVISSPLVTVEAENANVARTGNWTAQESGNASGGSYLYSSDMTGDALTLRFSGMQVKVVYVKHPAFGSFAIEVDGVLRQTITATAAEASFGAEMSISGLAAGSHTLRVYAVGGTVALDAFQVEGVTAASSTATPTPTAVATQNPTATPTEMPTSPPIAPSPTPIQLFTVEAESASVVKSGNWTEQATSSASGGSYLYSRGEAIDSLLLTFTGSRLDILYLQHPALGTFAIAIDGAPRKVITEAGAQAFGLHASFSGLSAGIHTAHIYPVNGVIAIDSFLVEPQTISIPTATPEPSATPIPATKSAISTPQPPTMTPTVEQASTPRLPTNVPTLTETPTATPTLTETPTEAASATETRTATPAQTPTATPTLTETPTETASATETRTATPIGP